MRARPPAPSVLVVEDEAVVAMDLDCQLHDMGYQVVGCVDNGHDAIARARSARPDLILMDIVLKGEMDGITAAALIGAELQIPVLFLTAYSDDQTVARAAAAWPYGYLTKPFQNRELRAGIEVALRKASLERSLRSSEHWLSSILRGVADCVIATDAQGRVRFLNPAAEALLGWSAAEVQGRPVTEVIQLVGGHSELAAPGLAGAPLGMASMLLARDGTRVPIEASVGPICDERELAMGAAFVLHDVRERLAAELRLKQSEQRFRHAFDNAPVGMALVDRDNRFVQVNHALCRLLDADCGQLVGVAQATFANDADMAIELEYQQDLLCGRADTVQFEKRYRSRDGRQVWALVSASLLSTDDDPQHFLLQITDFTERKHAEDELARLAHFDALTGVANRTLLAESIEREILVARRHQCRLAVLFIDLDYFKHINDSLGHEAGDTVLQVIAARLSGAVRETDTVGRIGGDEFVVVLSEVDDARAVLALTDKVRLECARPVALDGHQVRLAISIGISLFPDDAQDVRTLLRFADSALYHAKAEGRNNVQFYRPELTAHMESRIRLGAGLRVALEHHELELYYQPIVALDDNRTVAAEALIRWNHPQLGLLFPDTFLPVLDESSMGEAIGAWVIGQACIEAARWSTAGAGPIRVAVNVTAAQFKSGKLVPTVEQALAAAGLDGARLCIEITEQNLLADSERNRDTIGALKALGVHVAIDDFGTGYSSLSYISRFRPSELKIDQSLTTRVDSDPEHAALVVAALAMARSLKLDVVTEGVETEAEQTFLRAQGCAMAQGYLYARPCPAPAFRAWLTQQAPRAGHPG